MKIFHFIYFLTPYSLNRSFRFLSNWLSLVSLVFSSFFPLHFFYEWHFSISVLLVYFPYTVVTLSLFFLFSIGYPNFFSTCYFSSLLVLPIPFLSSICLLWCFLCYLLFSTSGKFVNSCCWLRNPCLLRPSDQAGAPLCWCREVRDLWGRKSEFINLSDVHWVPARFQALC